MKSVRLSRGKLLAGAAMCAAMVVGVGSTAEAATVDFKAFAAANGNSLLFPGATVSFGFLDVQSNVAFLGANSTIGLGVDRKNNANDPLEVEPTSENITFTSNSSAYFSSIRFSSLSVGETIMITDVDDNVSFSFVANTNGEQTVILPFQTFGLNVGGSSSGATFGVASITATPLPASAWAALGLTALFGLVAAKRKRDQQAA